MAHTRERRSGRVLHTCPLALPSSFTLGQVPVRAVRRHPVGNVQEARRGWCRTSVLAEAQEAALACGL